MGDFVLDTCNELFKLVYSSNNLITSYDLRNDKGI